MCKYLVSVNYSNGAPGDFVASGSAGAPSGRCGHARAAQHTTLCRRQCSTACYAGAAERGAGEEERRRDEGTGEGAKEVARTAGGKAAGAIIG